MAAEGFDYIVAGGGSSGCLVAARLAEAGARVLVLEAGPDDRSMLIRMPAGYVKLLGVERYMWFYKSVPQAHLGGRTPIVPQGRILGGGSSVNAMVYIRGQPADYDRWAEATGDPDWGYDALLPYFTGMEDNNRLNDRFHGVGGPWKVSDQAYVCDLSRAFLLAAQGAGLPFNPDFNGETQRGVGIYQITARDGRRCSAATAFLRPAMKTGRITLKTGVLVLSLVIEKGRAVGVRYREGSETREARATSEVVMAAGALATPKILMLSGIGPAAHLAEHGIAAALDLSGVGQNLQDHTETPVLAFCNGPYGYFGHDRGFRQIRNGIEYLVNNSGPVTSNGVEAGAFLDPDDLSGTPSIQQFCVPSVYLDKDHADVTPTYGVTINSCVARPRSRGAVRLASADPTAQALVDPNYLADPEDVRLSIGGVRRAREIMAQEPLRSMIEREVFPGPDKTSDEDLAAHARRFVKTVYHPCGTCRMGRDGEPDAVVTTDLRLRGIDGLRIVDASVIPTIISGNTNAAVLVVADKAAEFMLDRPPRARAALSAEAERPLQSAS
ncbi:MAG: GMC family oxidoreductase N-terminal domain-containing protein [Amaricoccus sp.]